MLLKGLGYKGNIISFEPLPSAFEILKKRAARDPSWQVYQLGLGERSGIFRINESQNSHSSSFLEMTSKHLIEAQNSRFIRAHEVQVSRLDDFVIAERLKLENTLLKIDTQGYEESVILGSKNSLSYIKLIQLEISFDELYKGEKLFLDICKFMDDLGFRVISLEPGFISKRDGFMLQSDIMFINTGLS